MAHYRTTIRAGVKATLIAAATLAGTRVYVNPTDDRVTFPALVVNDDGEDQTARSMPADAGRAIERRYTFEVRAEVQQVNGYDDTRDTLLAQVEAALAAPGATASGVKACTPKGCDFLQDNTGERPIAVGVQRFEALYYTTQGNPGAAL